MPLNATTKHWVLKSQNGDVYYDVTNVKRCKLQCHERNIKVHICGCYFGSYINVYLPLE